VATAGYFILVWRNQYGPSAEVLRINDLGENGFASACRWADDQAKRTGKPVDVYRVSDVWGDGSLVWSESPTYRTKREGEAV
jgi:hypothetical protein